MIFVLSGCQSRLFSISHIILHLLNYSLWISTLHLCRSRFPIHIICNPFLSLFIVYKVRLLSRLRHKCPLTSYGTQCSVGSDDFYFKCKPAFICLMTSSCRSSYGAAVFHNCKWQKVLYWSIAVSILSWLCCWVTWWMLQVRNHMDANCDFYGRVDMFNQHEQCKICILTVSTWGIQMRTLQHDLIVSDCFM